MNDNHDEALQRLLEEQFKKMNKGKALPDHPDARLYELLFRELADDTSLPARPSIADAVFRRLEHNIERKEAFKYRICVVLVVIAGALATALAAANLKPEMPALAVVREMIHTPVLMFVIVTFCLVCIFGRIIMEKSPRRV